MKLRHKKTGEIKEYTHTMTSYHVPIKGGYEIFTPWKPEEWEELEDVKEPLIKDEKVKKLLGEVVELELTVNELSKRFDEFNKHYVELCGEEEE